MSWKLDKETGDLVLSGFEEGIASSPLKGFGDIKSANIATINGEVSLSYGRARQTQSKFTLGSMTPSTSSTLIASSGSAIQAGLLRGTWVIANSSSITNFTNGTHYYVLSSTNGNIQFALDYEGSVITNFGITGSAGFTVVPMGKPIAWAADSQDNPNFYSYYILDNTGLVWKTPPGAASAATPLGAWSLIDYTPVTNITDTSGLFIYGQYVHVITTAIYWKNTGSITGLGHTTPWAAMNDNSSSPIVLAGGDAYHNAIVSIDNAVYFCGLDDNTQGANSAVNSILVNPATSYNAGDESTYTYTPGAILIPLYDQATTLAQIVVQGGVNILVGGTQNVIYVWAPGSSNAAFSPLFLAENYTQQMVTVNNLVFIFAGSKGNIYVTNASSVTVALTVPDYVADSMGGNQDPYFVWGGAMYLRGRIYFSVKAPNCGGIWSFIPTINYYPEQDVGYSLRCENQNSYGNYSGLATILFPNLLPTGQNANGPQYWAGWDDGTSGTSINPYGIDYSDTIPTFEYLIESDAAPTGTFLQKKTFKQIEYKTAVPFNTLQLATAPAKGATTATLAVAWTGTGTFQYILFSTGEYRACTVTPGSTAIAWFTGALTQAASTTIYTEMIQINYRTQLNGSWTTPSVLHLEAGTVSGYYTVDFQNTQWIQLQIIGRGTTLSPTFTPLVEVRIR